MSSTLHIEKLSAGYGAHPVVSNFNLILHQGELVGLKGRNGKGKTTLLKTICGLLPPISGSVRINGSEIHTLQALERSGLISIVLTDRIRLKGIAVRELVEMGRYRDNTRLRFRRADDSSTVDHCLKSLSLMDIAEKPLSEISDGELQKAMIARALAQKTPFIIMDEPTAFLDYVAKEELFLLLSKMVQEENIAILFSSHDIDLMEKVATRVIEI